jgi:hypothetical protein
LKGLKPVANAVAGPFGPNDRSTIFVFDVLPAAVYNRLQTPPIVIAQAVRIRPGLAVAFLPA